MEVTQRFEPRLVFHQLEQRRALASGKHEAVDVSKLSHATHLDDGHAECGVNAGVGLEAALQGQHTDSHHYQPRVCSSSDSSSWLVSMPGMALPKPREISASVSKSS